MNLNSLLTLSPFTCKIAAIARPWICVLLAVPLVVAPLQSAWAQQPEKKIGFGISVSTDGIFSSTIAKVAVTQVTPDSQALAAGVLAGDEIVKIQDITVPGNNAAKLKEHMDFVPGVPKKITFKRATGTEYDVVFTRVVNPKTGG
jgi:membrane-associated protease RseP (regulator of RpoE activity)